MILQPREAPHGPYQVVQARGMVLFRSLDFHEISFLWVWFRSFPDSDIRFL